MQQALLRCFEGYVSGDPQRMQASEAKINEYSASPGFCTCLANLFAQQGLHAHQRQLASILLKNTIRARWDKSSEEFKGGQEVGETEKKRMRSGILELLKEPAASLRKSIAMSVAIIGHFDFPEKWPGLLGNLLTCLKSDNTNLVQGALRTFVLLTESLTNQDIIKCLSHLSPALFHIVSSAKYQPEVRAQAIRLFDLCILKPVGSNDDLTKLHQTLRDSMQPWMNHILRLLSQKMDVNNGKRMIENSMGVKLLITLECLHKTTFKPFRSKFFQTLGKIIADFAPIYEQTAVMKETDSYAVSFDDDGEMMGLGVFLADVIDFIRICIHDSPELLGSHVGPLASLAIGYMKITSTEVKDWEAEPNDFVAYEDNIENLKTVRAAATELFGKITDVLEMHETSVKDVLSAIQFRLKSAYEQKGVKVPTWWKEHEACIYAMGLLSGTLEGKQYREASLRILETAILPVLKDPNPKLPFTHSRAVWCIGHFGSVLRGSQKHLNASMEGLIKSFNSDFNIVVRWAACRSVGFICALEFPREVVNLLLRQTIPSIVDLISTASGVGLTLALDSFTVALGSNIEIAQAIADRLVPVLLKVWIKHHKAYMLTENLNELFVLLAGSPKGFKAVITHALPTMVGIIQRGIEDKKMTTEGMVTRAIELIHALVREHNEIPTDLLKVVPALLQLLLTTDDHSVLQEGSSLTRSLVRKAKSVIINEKVSGKPLLEIIGSLVIRLLNPNLQDLAAIYAGELVTELAFGCGKEIGPEATKKILGHVVFRLSKAQHPALVESLTTFLARIIHASGPTKALDLLAAVTLSDTHASAVGVILTIWTAHLGAFESIFDKKVCLLALADLLNDPRIFTITVSVERIQTKGSGYGTRSRVEKKSVQISMATRIVELLCEKYAEDMIEAVCEAEGADETMGTDLSDMLMYGMQDQKAELEIRPEIKNDPLYSIKMLEAIPKIIGSLRGKRGPGGVELLDAISKQMSPEGRDQLLGVMAKLKSR
ncbi:hypothetical protein AAMO2058_000528000 [Amorphochlora amoebiformis]